MPAKLFGRTISPSRAKAQTTVPPRESAIFSPPPATSDVRYAPDGNGWIVIADPLEYPRVPALDCNDPGSLFYTYRPSLFGIDVPDEWDFYNLINTDRPDFTDAMRHQAAPVDGEIGRAKDRDQHGRQPQQHGALKEVR